MPWTGTPNPLFEIFGLPTTTTFHVKSNETPSSTINLKSFGSTVNNKHAYCPKMERWRGLRMVDGEGGVLWNNVDNLSSGNILRSILQKCTHLNILSNTPPPPPSFYFLVGWAKRMHSLDKIQENFSTSMASTIVVHWSILKNQDHQKFWSVLKANPPKGTIHSCY